MKKSYIKILAITILLLTNYPIFAENNGGFEHRISSIEKLLTGSSVSRKILDSGNKVAIQYYKYAKTSFDSAVIEYHKGQINKADFFLKSSKSALFEAVMHINSGDSRNRKTRHDYEAKRRSVHALTDALERISKEKGRTSESRNIVSKASTLTQQADQYYFEKYYNNGITVLNEALKVVEVAISNMRTGDTLISALVFENDEEEYIYELDRNDTHLMLLTMFLSESPDNYIDKSIEKNQTSAKEHRQLAEKLASQGKYKDAIKEMDKSTGYIIQAIKSTGIYLPG